MNYKIIFFLTLTCLFSNIVQANNTECVYLRVLSSEYEMGIQFEEGTLIKICTNDEITIGERSYQIKTKLTRTGTSYEFYNDDIGWINLTMNWQTNQASISVINSFEATIFNFEVLDYKKWKKIKDIDKAEASIMDESTYFLRHKNSFQGFNKTYDELVVFFPNRVYESKFGLKQLSNMIASLDTCKYIPQWYNKSICINVLEKAYFNIPILAVNSDYISSLSTLENRELVSNYILMIDDRFAKLNTVHDVVRNETLYNQSKSALDSIKSVELSAISDYLVKNNRIPEFINLFERFKPYNSEQDILYGYLYLYFKGALNLQLSEKYYSISTINKLIDEILIYTLIDGCMTDSLNNPISNTVENPVKMAKISFDMNTQGSGQLNVDGDILWSGSVIEIVDELIKAEMLENRVYIPMANDIYIPFSMAFECALWEKVILNNKIKQRYSLQAGRVYELVQTESRNDSGPIESELWRLIGPAYSFESKNRLINYLFNLKRNKGNWNLSLHSSTIYFRSRQSRFLTIKCRHSDGTTASFIIYGDQFNLKNVWAFSQSTDLIQLFP